MKKILLLLPPILLVFQLVKAQKPDAAVAIVRYSFSHIRDTTNKANVYTENMELLIGKNASVYRSADKRSQYEQMKKQIAEQIRDGAGSNFKVEAVNKTQTSNTEYYQFQAEKKLFRKETIINTYLLEEPLQVIKWKITSDTASFSGLHCQKATTTLKGRNYEAWFCPALPFRSGPWKLNGLPGLIVEASDTKKEVIWKFTGLEDADKLTEKPVEAAEAGSVSGKVTQVIGLGDDNAAFKTIALPKNGIKATEKELAQLKETMQKDPQAFLLQSLAGTGANVKIKSITQASPEQIRKNTINNPIELSEKP